MEVHFTAEQEAQLAQIASVEGTDAEQLVRQAALRLLAEVDRQPAAPIEVPKVHLGPMTSLHRRDIYDDAD